MFIELGTQRQAPPGRAGHPRQTIKETFAMVQAGQDEEEEEDELSLAQAIQSYKSQILTGARELTDREKEEIDQLIREFLSEHPLDAEDDTEAQGNRDALNNFLEALYKQYGHPANFYDFAGGVIGSELAKLEPPLYPPFEMKIPPEPERKPMLEPFHAILPQQLALAGAYKKTPQEQGQHTAV